MRYRDYRHDLDKIDLSALQRIFTSVIFIIEEIYISRVIAVLSRHKLAAWMPRKFVSDVRIPHSIDVQPNSPRQPI